MSSPADALSLTDLGDEMQRRLRYQAAYGSLVCLDLLEQETTSELFCEHHEDFLMRKADGQCVGIQVKTRATHLGPFVSNDEPIVGALTRFVQLELQFPNKFERFVIVANCDFWQGEKTEKNLRYVIAQLQRNPAFKLAGTMKTVVDKIRQSCKCKRNVVVETLCRTRLEGTVPKFEDITGTIAIRIGRLTSSAGRYFEEFFKCAVALIDYILERSALTCDLPSRSHFIFSSNPEEALTKATIKKKRVTSADVLDLIQQVLGPQTSLHTAAGAIVQQLPLGTHVMEKKMAAGGISFQSIDVAKDHQASIEYVLQQWLHQYGEQVASERFQQLDVLVRTQCAEAYDASYSAQTAFGAAMLADVRKRLKVAASTDPSLFKLRYEHLLGVASLATQECRVWWSGKFDLERDN